MLPFSSSCVNLAKLWAKCRKVSTSIVFVLLRHMYYRLRGRNILTSNGVTIDGLENITTAESLTVGLSHVGFMSRHDRTLLYVRGKLNFRGKFSLGKGCRVDVAENAVASFGSGYVSAGSTFVIMHGMTVGDDCAISWDCKFVDEDFHEFDYPGRVPRETKAITVGSHVWICSGVTVLKGAVIPDGCIVAAGSLVTSQFTTKNALLAGRPAKVIREDVTWQ